MMNYVTLDSEGFATESGMIKYYTTDTDDILIGEVEDFISIGTGLPSRGYIDPPPEAQYGFVIVRNSDAWVYVEDHRGQIVYDIQTGKELIVSVIGPLPDGVTTIKPEPDRIDTYTYELNILISKFLNDTATLTSFYNRAALIDGIDEQMKKQSIYNEYQQRKQQHTDDMQALKLKYEV